MHVMIIKVEKHRTDENLPRREYTVPHTSTYCSHSEEDAQRGKEQHKITVSQLQHFRSKFGHYSQKAESRPRLGFPKRQWSEAQIKIDEEMAAETQNQSFAWLSVFGLEPNTKFVASTEQKILNELEMFCMEEISLHGWSAERSIRGCSKGKLYLALKIYLKIKAHLF